MQIHTFLTKLLLLIYYTQESMRKTAGIDTELFRKK